MCRTMKELENVVADYRKMKTSLDKVSEQVKALEREIIGYLDTNQKITETGKDFTVKVSTCERRTLDSKRLEADLGSLAEYQRISQYRCLYNIIDLEPKANENIPRVQIPSKGIRKKFSPDVRKLLYIHAGGRCELCGREMALEDVTIDHIKPLAMGGTNDVSNLACTCFGCNHLKGSAVPESFFQRVNDIFMFQMEKKYKKNVWWKLVRVILGKIS